MKLRKSIAAGGLLAAAVMAGCGGGSSSTAGGGAPAGSSGGRVQINGAGATFPYPIYSKWFEEFGKQHPDVAINYQSIGSGGGIRQMSAETVFFGATDGPMTDEQLAAAHRAILHFPTVLGADVPVYNVANVGSDLKFSGALLADVFLGRIRKWDDPAIAKLNPGVRLPATDITVVHRSDGSGTTYIWADYLSKVSPEWKSKVGVNTSVNWPVGVGGKGNEGVAGLVTQTPGSIGYVELIYAIQNTIAYGSVQNAGGEFVKASEASVTAAAAASAAKMPDDFRVSITNAAGAGAYPISSFTWLLLFEDAADKNQARVMVDFLKWALTDGQGFAAPLGYAPLPAEVIKREMAVLDRVKVG
jgi:phosphate transport system substrate-binding protein